jgi:hypothetical protein
MSQADLARALQAWLPRLHPHHIRQRDAQHVSGARTHLSGFAAGLGPVLVGDRPMNDTVPPD